MTGPPPEMQKFRIFAPMAIEAWAARRGVLEAYKTRPKSFSRPFIPGTEGSVVKVGMGPGNSILASRALESALEEIGTATIAGLCGATAPGLETGDVIVATEVRGSRERRIGGTILEEEVEPIDLPSSNDLAEEFSRRGIKVVAGPVKSYTKFVPRRRRMELAEKKSVLAVDMESYWLLENYARQSGPLTGVSVIRVVLDPLTHGVLAPRVIARVPSALRSISVACRLLAESAESVGQDNDRQGGPGGPAGEKA